MCVCVCVQSLTLPSTASGQAQSASSAAASPAAANASAVSFRELLLQRGVPRSLATYLMCVFRQHPSAGTPAGTSAPPSAHRRWTSTHDGPAGVLSPSLLSDAAGGSPRATPASPNRGARGVTVDLASLPATPGVALSPQNPLSRSAVGGGGGGGGGGSSVWMPEDLARWCLPAGTGTFKATLVRPGVAAALKLLVSMCQGHAGVAGQIASAALPPLSDVSGTNSRPTSNSGVAGTNTGPLLPLLHLLEGVAGGAVIAPLAEALLDALAATDNGAAGGAAAGVAAAVKGLREASKTRAKELAARRRQAMLSAMGMSPRAEGSSAGAAAGDAALRSPQSAWSTPAATPAQTMGGAASSMPARTSTSGSGAAPAAPTGPQLAAGVTSQAGFQAPETSGPSTSVTPGAQQRPSPRDFPLPSPAGSQLAMELAALEAEESDETQSTTGNTHTHTHTCTAWPVVYVDFHCHCPTSVSHDWECICDSAYVSEGPSGLEAAFVCVCVCLLMQSCGVLCVVRATVCVPTSYFASTYTAKPRTAAAAAQTARRSTRRRRYLSAVRQACLCPRARPACLCTCR